MSAFVEEPPRRLRERRDQSNLFERLAGEAVRDLPRAKPLSPTTLARIAARIGERAPAAPPRRRYRWVLVTAAFLLGIAATASAQRLDGLRRWFTRIVTAEPKLAGRDASLRPTGMRRAVQARPQVSVTGEAAPAPSQELPAPEPARAEPAGVASDWADGADGVEGVKSQRRPSTPPSTPPLAKRRSNPQPESRARSAPALASPPLPRPVDRGSATDAPGSVAAPASGHDVQLAFVDPRDAPRPSPPRAAPSVVATAPAPAVPGVAPAQPAPADPAEAKAVPSAVNAQQATKYLTRAVRALRVERSPETALRLLDRHASELAGDAFSREALLLRVDALLALDRRDEVLRLLDSSALTAGAAARGLLLVRGQLRAAANRCADALGDFDLVLAEARKPPKAALLARARCRQMLGDRAGAKADQELFRREFPGERALDDLAGPLTRP